MAVSVSTFFPGGRSLPIVGGGVPPRSMGAFRAPSSFFKSCFDRQPFLFDHALADNAMFKLERVAELADQLEPKGAVTYASVNARVGGGWEGFGPRKKNSESLSDAINRLESSGIWVKITRINDHERQYQELVERLIDEMANLSGRPLRREITRISSTLFIASPGAVTPYHMDHETNFLFQLRGKKIYRIVDASNREIVPLKDVERFLVTGLLDYRKDAAASAKVYDLHPGRGVHHPSWWPHWAMTGSEPSISLSVNFCLRDRDLDARVHQCNYFLRHVGLQPVPPGRSRIRDGMKKTAFASFRRRRPAKSIDEHLRGHLRRVEVPLSAFRWLKRHLKRPVTPP